MRLISSKEDLKELVDELGFLPFFKNEIAGFSIEERILPRLWFSDTEDGPWEWKGEVICETGCAYGKLFCGKAGFVSAKWYPDFANYRRDGYDFDARCEDGLVPYSDKLVYEIIAGRDSLLSKEVKRLGGFSKRGKSGFDSIIARLQMLCYVTTADFEYQRDRHGKPYGWGVARYATPENHFKEPFCNAVYQRSPQESKQRILKHLSTILPNATENERERLLH
ncbi:MAG: hypothetical protein Q4C01_02240 [Clostridia bacterium]|nr:hypothetical protein [Clostridia bacterium]